MKAAFYPPARFLDMVSDAEMPECWWMDENLTWGVLVHEGTAYTACIGTGSALVGVAKISAELWEEGE